jgi:hypothetical protein
MAYRHPQDGDRVPSQHLARPPVQPQTPLWREQHPALSAVPGGSAWQTESKAEAVLTLPMSPQTEITARMNRVTRKRFIDASVPGPYAGMGQAEIGPLRALQRAFIQGLLSKLAVF